jgi:hypothetical protein
MSETKDQTALRMVLRFGSMVFGASAIFLLALPVVSRATWTRGIDRSAMVNAHDRNHSSGANWQHDCCQHVCQRPRS